MILAACEVEVVVLCHSLSEAECEYAKREHMHNLFHPKSWCSIKELTSAT
jgi:hypothetical protein